jgi:hypothetical protein
MPIENFLLLFNKFETDGNALLGAKVAKEQVKKQTRRK